MVMNKIYFSSDKPQAYACLRVNYFIRKILYNLILIFTLLASIQVFTQTLGDYRSVNPGGPWTNLSSWQYYNGSSWVAATTYPGQNATGTGNVLIQSGHSITIGTTGINTGTIGSITITGNLTLTGVNTGGTGTDYIFNTPSIIVTPLQGTITFINKVNLKLPGNAVLSVTSDTTPNPDYYGLIGDCNHNQDIYIGTSVYAYCNGAGETGLTFDDVMDGGGTLDARPSSNTPVCEGSQINLFGTYSGTAGSTVTYNWAIVAPGGGNSSSSLQNPTIPNAIAGTYNITLTCSTIFKGNTYSNYETISVLVNSRPTTISIGTITQPTCSVSTGSVILNNLPSSGTWTINPGAISGSGTSTTVSGLASGNYTFTVTNSSGCVSIPSSSVAISPPGKNWNGSNSSDWFTASNWTPSGVPTSTDCVTINNSGIAPIISGTTIAYAYSLTILGSGNLQISSNSSLQVTDFVNVNPSGVFTIKNSGSLVQVNNVSNTGNINMERTAFIDFRDYVYWSSPVVNFNSGNISSFSNNSNLYKWIPTVVGNGVGNFGTWINGTETMVTGKGYIERGLNNAPLNSPTNFTATFTGIPNNGDIDTVISRGSYIGDSYNTPVISPTEATMDDDNWNLLGNPYPSSISASDFLIANQDNLDGYVRIWTHGTSPNTNNPDPFYGNYGYNYDINDYITWNLSGPTFPGFNGYIASGQGFFTKMLDSNITNTAIFNNNMRSPSYTNSDFFKINNQKSSSIDEGRIWLDLVSSNSSTTTLIAYINGATNERDRLYDSKADLKSNFRVTSLLNYERLTIQGKKAPFNQEDIINLAMNVPTNNTYTLAIKSVDGIFTNQNQNIFLEDKLLHVIHDLRSEPYQFIATQGESIDRFVLRYTNQTLSNNIFDYNNSIAVYVTEAINIKSSLENIKSVKMYDTLGKIILFKNNIDQKEVALDELKPTSNLLIVKVILNNGNEIVKKILF